MVEKVKKKNFFYKQHPQAVEDLLNQIMYSCWIKVVIFNKEPKTIIVFGML